MAKRIVICSDGTGNTAIKGRGTNVFKVFEAIDLDSHRFDETVTPQVAIYDDGVGSGNFKPVKFFAGATGWGLSRNVKHLYAELARIYDPGDEIYMFGFSRGAFTVRTLVGFIATCGIVDVSRIKNGTSREFNRLVGKAYRSYRQCYAPTLLNAVMKPSRSAGEHFKSQYSHQHDVRVRFVGVWDTVDAVGLPFRLADVINATVYRFKFPDQKLSSTVDRACHALAIDDERQSFHPLMFEETPHDAGRIEQVWFAGCHSNVGGGYPKQGMSLVTLDWMLEQAESAGAAFKEHGLRLNKADRVSFREHATVDDKLYDPRSGAGVLYRWKIRDIAAICRKFHVQPKIHVSVMERIAHGTDAYSPGNLPANATVVFSEPPNCEDAELAVARAAVGQEAVKRIPDPSLLAPLRGSMRLGAASYFLFLVSSLVALVAATGRLPNTQPVTIGAAARAVAVGLTEVIRGPWDTLERLFSTRPHPLMIAAALGLVLAYLLALSVDRRLSGVFSGHWFKEQQNLRAGLKKVRQSILRTRAGAA